MFVDGEEILDYLGRVIGTQDEILLGRGTYDYWVYHWPTSDMEPFASFINNTPKYVFTSRELTPAWNRTTAIGAPAEGYVADLKRRDGADMGIHGSVGLARSLLRANLVDEMRLVIAPTVAPRGRRLFTELDDQQRQLDLLDSRHTPGGALLLDYRIRHGESG